MINNLDECLKYVNLHNQVFTNEISLAKEYACISKDLKAIFLDWNEIRIFC